MRYINEHGGINGIPLELLWADSEYKFSLEMDHFKRFYAQEAVLFIAWSSTIAEKMKPEAERMRFPMIFGCCTEAQIIPPGWSWGLVPPYGDIMAGMVEWILKNRWGKKTPPKLVTFGWDNAFGHGAESAHPYLQEKYGVKIAPFQAVPFNTLDMTPQILAGIAREKADIIVDMMGGESSVLAKDLIRLGYRDKVEIILPNGTATGASIAKLNPNGANGMLLAMPAGNAGFLEYKIDMPGMKECVEYQKKIHNGNVEQGIDYYYQGWGVVLAAAKAIKMAADKVGVNNVGGADVQDALQQLNVTGADTLGALRIIKGTKTDRALSDAVVIAEWNEAKRFTVPLTGWYVVPKMREWKK